MKKAAKETKERKKEIKLTKGRKERENEKKAMKKNYEKDVK